MNSLSGEAFIPELTAELLARSRLSLAGKSGFRESAVLVPLLLSETGPPSLLYIVRNASLPTHSGHIAFPGGKRELSDTSIEHTALRESHEEIGLDAAGVRVCGLLDDVPTTGFFSITPVVGILKGPQTLQLRAEEVAETFIAPLPELVRCFRHLGHAEWLGARHAVYEFPFQETLPHGPTQIRRIWGATARVTFQLLELLGLLSESSPR